MRKCHLKIENLRKFKIPGQKIVEVVEIGLFSLFLGLCLIISGNKVLVDGFENIKDGTQNPKFEKSGTKSSGICREILQFCGSGLVPDDL